MTAPKAIFEVMRQRLNGSGREGPGMSRRRMQQLKKAPMCVIFVISHLRWLEACLLAPEPTSGGILGGLRNRFTHLCWDDVQNENC